MKKLLLACAAIIAVSANANADKIAFVAEGATYSGDGEAVTLPTGNIAGNTYGEDQSVSFLITKVNSSVSQVNSKAVRWYANDLLILTPADGVVINSITFLCTANWGVITVNGDSQTPSASNKIITFSALDASEAVTVSHSAQNRFDYLEVEYTPASSDLQAANLSFPEAEYRVKFPNGEFTAPVLTKDTDAVAVYTSSDEAVATVAADGAVTIIKPGTTTITAKCAANDKFTGGSAKYTLVVYAAASSLEDLTELAALDAKGTFRIDCPLTVTYINGLNMYVVDAKGDATLIYGTKFEFNPGDVLSTGWMVIYSPYNNLPEYKISGDAPTVVSNGAVFEIPEVKLADVNDTMLNKLINLVNVPIKDEIPQSKTSVVVTDGDASLTFYNTFEVPPFTPEEGKSYRVKGIVSIYKETIQFAPIEYSIESGVAPIEANEGIATYFDLNGRQVKGQLANGIYVKVANGKATKVVVK